MTETQDCVGAEAENRVLEVAAVEGTAALCMVGGAIGTSQPPGAPTPLLHVTSDLIQPHDQHSMRVLEIEQNTLQSPADL